jgi:alanyl-tRNA synthetase
MFLFWRKRSRECSFDQEADIWKQFVSESEYFKTKDNFGDGDQGPCGPCSEIHIVTCSGGELLSQVLGLGILIIPQV